MKNVTNEYGFYLSEDDNTIRFEGTFGSNYKELKTKDPSKILEYQLFVSPSKKINFAVNVIGSERQQVIYIPQHVYNDLVTAYEENNPFYTIKDVTIVKIDLTPTGLDTLNYVDTKYNKSVGEDKSRFELAGVAKIKNYAGFTEDGIPDDIAILNQILYLYEEQNEVIFVDKESELVTEQIVADRGYTSERIRGGFNVISVDAVTIDLSDAGFEYFGSYFDSTDTFVESLLNSSANIKRESTLRTTTQNLNDFIKDFKKRTITNEAEDDEQSKSGTSGGSKDYINKMLLGVGTTIRGLELISGLSKGIKVEKVRVSKLEQKKIQRELKILEQKKKEALLNKSAVSARAQEALDAKKREAEAKLKEIKDAKKKAKEAWYAIKGIFAKTPRAEFIIPKQDKFKLKQMQNSFESVNGDINEKRSKIDEAKSKANELKNKATQAKEKATKAAQRTTKLSNINKSGLVGETFNKIDEARNKIANMPDGNYSVKVISDGSAGKEQIDKLLNQLIDKN